MLQIKKENGQFPNNWNEFPIVYMTNSFVLCAKCASSLGLSIMSFSILCQANSFEDVIICDGCGFSFCV